MNRMIRSDSILERSDNRYRGFSLLGFLCTLIVLGSAGMLALRAGPSVIEYWAVKKAISAAVAMSDSPAEVRSAFDKLAAAGFIDSVEGKDLDISGRGKEMQVSFSYQKRISLVGPASLLIEYRGSTANDGSEKAAN